MKILPASKAFRPRSYRERPAAGDPTFRLAGSRAAAGRDAAIRRVAASSAFAVASAVPYVAQQIGQIMLEDEGPGAIAAGAAAAYRRAARTGSAPAPVAAVTA
ncbi:MAG: hypothetical protein GEU92_05075 [Alphaproteobacteria bacterium]|nr:hypothetical protein [Alphaproteobacteria bacterium]